MPPLPPADPLTGMVAARFGVYVHFPYCLSKCPYCDFASTVARQIPAERYAKAIARELALRAPPQGGPPVESIYFGGGTPSLWDARYVAAVLEAIAAALPIAEGVEVTLEANPGASDVPRFSDFRRVGVDRLSIGVQSFQPSTLAALGREHDAAAARAAYAAARAAGFDNVSLDFIYGVHGQTPAQARADAVDACALGPDHLSAYALTLDKEALAEEVPLAKQLSRGEVALPPDSVVSEMGAAVREVYGTAGLARYEISNCARPGRHSRHNLLYWTGGEYLALGAGATGCLRRGEGAERYTNHRSAERYLEAVEAGRLPQEAPEQLGRRELFAERLAMGLRLSSGVDLAGVCSQFGEPLERRQREAERAVAGGLARWAGPRLALTERGAELHSALAARLM